MLSEQWYTLLTFIYSVISSVQFSSSDMSNALWPRGLQHAKLPCPSPLLALAQTHVHWVSDSLQPSHPFHPLLLHSIFIRVYSSESVLCIRWPKYWSFNFNISPSNVHLGLISFRIEWFDHLVVQGTLKSLLQHHISKASILQRSAFFIAQLIHPLEEY